MSLKKRVQRIEEFVNEGEGLTCDDIELILSAFPPDFAAAVRNKILETDKQGCAGQGNRQPFGEHGKSKPRSGLHGKTLELILSALPEEYSAAVKKLLEAR